jgi:hypothetical protein
MYCPIGLSANTKPRIAPIPAPAINPNENRNRPLYIFNNPIRTTEPITIYCVGIRELKENFLAGGDAGFSFVSTMLIRYLEFCIKYLVYEIDIRGRFYLEENKFKNGIQSSINLFNA